MTRRFIDRDGVEWRVWWEAGKIPMALPPDRAFDPGKIPPPPGGLHIRSEGFGFFVEVSEVDPSEFTEEELQRMIDEHPAR